LDTTSPAGLVTFNRLLDERIDRTIVNLRDANAQGLIFWDLEGLEFAAGYIGDPRQLARLAPEMEAAADRMFARIRAAGFAIGMTVRCERAERTASGDLQFERLHDPVREIQAKVAYAQQRWGATLFIIIGNGGDALTMSTITRRVNAASPAVLLIPTGADLDTFRWGAPWYNPQQATSPPLAAAAREHFPSAFTIYAPLEANYLLEQRDQLVRAVAAGDVLTFRAWMNNSELKAVQSIYATAAVP
jgi:hypothetical protein